MEKYVIIKEMEYNGKTLHVIILDSMGEVLEFDSRDEANRISELMEYNSDSGWRYTVKKI